MMRMNAGEMEGNAYGEEGRDGEERMRVR